MHRCHLTFWSRLVKKQAKGTVVGAVDNLLYVRFEGSIRQGEMGYVLLDKDHPLKGEVIEVQGDLVKMQIFENTRGISEGVKVDFSGDLLEAELGPGLLTSIFDGLQNPLEKVAASYGNFLPRGVYIAPLDRKRTWEFFPSKQPNEMVAAGDELGHVLEEDIEHKIMAPFTIKGSYKIETIVSQGSYPNETPLAQLPGENGTVDVTMVQRWPVKQGLMLGEKIKPTEMMETGCRVIDTQFPVVRGGTFCSPGPFGAGKTVLQHHLAKYSNVDIVIICACGERAGEIVEVLKTFPHLTDTRTGKLLMNRTVIIGNTSSMPVAAREASVYMGMTIGEYYRQMGLNVLLLADSTSRWAQAMREMSGRLEEIPGDEAFPAYLASRIAAFYERAGALSLKESKTGSLTIGATVSPAGGNFEEPVTQATLCVVGAFHGLSRARSDARRYPAIDPLTSWSKYVDRVGTQIDHSVKGWANKVRTAKEILHSSDEIARRMEVVGEEGIAIEDMLLHLKGELYDFCYLQQNAFDANDTYCPLDRQFELFRLIWSIFELPCQFESKDEMRSFFLGVQNELRNLNYTTFNSEEYQQLKQQIEHKIQEKAKAMTAQNNI